MKAAWRLNPVRWWVLLALASLLLVPATSARADAGPKPGMEFKFEYKIPTQAILEGQLLECDDEACATATPLRRAGPQHFDCADGFCSSIAYGYAPYHKLVIEFADRTRESNVFGKRGYNARYRVTVTEEALQVDETTSVCATVCPCFPASLLTLFLETLVASIYLGAFGLPKALLPWVPCSSLLTLPAVWFVFPLLGLSTGWTVGLSEGFAVLAEAGLMYLAVRRAVSLRHVAALSVVMNLASFLPGLLLTWS